MSLRISLVGALRRGVVLAVAVLTFLSIACRGISQSEAKRLIAEHYHLPKPVTGLVLYGDYWICSDLNVPQQFGLENAIANGLVFLRQDGERQDSNCVTTYKSFHYLAELTPAGQAYATGETKLIDPLRYGAAVRECEEDIGEITGISLEQAGQAKVEYTTTTVRPTPFASADARCAQPTATQHHAYLTKYDSGWRFEAGMD